MKVKVKEAWYDSDRQPLLVRLSQEERKLLNNMSGDDVNFCVFPEGTPAEAVKAFMGATAEKSFELHQLTGE